MPIENGKHSPIPQRRNNAFLTVYRQMIDYTERNLFVVSFIYTLLLRTRENEDKNEYGVKSDRPRAKNGDAIAVS